MKKITALFLTAIMAFALVLTGCGDAEKSGPKTGDDGVKSEGVMTYAEYDAAELESPVVIEAFVQNKQSWWDNKATVYAQDKDGAYFLYDMACSEEDYAKLVPGTKIKVTGYKSEWSGEFEITDATFEIKDGSFIAEAKDVTDLVGSDDLVKSQNQFVTVKGLTVTDVSFKNEPGTDDIYVTTTLGDTEFSLCVEFYLTGSDTKVYKDVQALAVGDVIDVEGFLYWYNGAQVHLTSVVKK